MAQKRNTGSIELHFEPPMPSTDLATQLNETRLSLNIVWTLLAGFLVMFMQAGFALVETGLTRAKNAAHTMAMNLLVYPIGILGFWATGFALSMGGIGSVPSLGIEGPLNAEFSLRVGNYEFGLFGLQGFFLLPELLTPAVATLFFFQQVFMHTAATIPTGAAAERWKFTSFVLFSSVVATVIYPVYANWVWGGGWLSKLGQQFGWGHGQVDFAGSSVVHMTGGVMALVLAQQLGPRAGKYRPDGSARAIPGHSLPLVVLGTFILAFGWFGFNAGSTLAGTDSRIAVVATNTALSSASGAVSAYLFTKFRYGAPDLSLLCNGMLGGLVAITAPCAFVTTPVAVMIGAIAGIVVILSSSVVEQTLKVDDPVGAISVHGACGTFGVLCVGLFADGRYGDGLNGVPGPVRGLFYGDPGQLIAACIAIIANILWVAPVTFLTLKVIGALVGNRCDTRDEVDGLDLSEMGGPGYPQDLGERRATEAPPTLAAPRRLSIVHPPSGAS
jgi:ammonium transporter, Amt family